MIRFDHVSFAYETGEAQQETRSGAQPGAQPGTQPAAADAQSEAQHAATGVYDLNFEIAAGQTVLLCGDSGCGKTTVTRLINGLAPYYFDGSLSGRVTVAGMDTATAPGGIAAIARHVGSVFQNPKSQFFTLDVTGELAFACENFQMPPDEIRERIATVASDFHMENLLDRSITALSGGQKQKVACASVSTAGPDVLVLDEPSSNLDARAIADLRAIIELWKAQGKTVVIAEHRLYWLDGLIDRALYMRDGRITRDMTGSDLRNLSAAEREELGLRPVRASQIAQMADATASATNATANLSASPARTTPAWHINNFRYTYRHAKQPTLDVTDLDLRAGEVTAVIGFNGAGKSTFVRCLQGLDRRCQGTLTPPESFDYTHSADSHSMSSASSANPSNPMNPLHNRKSSKLSKPVKPLKPLDRKARLNACFTVLQDVNCELFTESVLDEVLLAMPDGNATNATNAPGSITANASSPGSTLPNAAITETPEAIAHRILQSLDLDQFADRHPLSLSGGQKQRVAIAAALASQRQIIIFDEPTSGLDMRHMREVAQLIRELAAMQRTVIVVTHDPEFALAAADNVIAISNGHLADTYPLRNATGAAGATNLINPAAAHRLTDTLIAKTTPSYL